MENRKVTDQSRIALYTGLVLFLFFLSYYMLTASLLPQGAGPDYPVSNDISRFVYDNYSLPVLPEDADALMFTPGGTTRATRPPASYIISGLLAHLSPYQNTDSFLAWRHGSALTSALTLLVVFATIYIYFQSIAYALSGSILLGLLPQFTFIASYNNDDSAGILSASLVMMSMVLIHRRGVNFKSIAIMAASCGFVLLTKFTAWLVLPFAGIYTLWQARNQYQIWWKYFLLSLLLIVVFGGWWILSNVYHYGWNDPLQFGIGQSLIEAKRTKLHFGSGGFIAQGVSYYHLLFENYNNFVTQSVKSLIGNLDWLRLPLGIYQYAFYILIIGAAILYVPVILLSAVGGGKRASQSWYPPRSDIGFSIILLTMIAFQVFMYVRFNFLHDVQMQGKYILPVMSAIMVLFFSSVNILDRISVEVRRHKNDRAVGFFAPAVILAALFVHVDAYLHYVVPFYNPPDYTLKIDEFKPVELNQNRYIEKKIRLSVETTPDGAWLIESKEKDPQILMTSAFCDVVEGYSMIEIDISSSAAERFNIYIDTGQGFNAKQHIFSAYEPGKNRLLIASGIKACKRIRIDPMNKQGRVVIKSISVAPLSITPRR